MRPGQLDVAIIGAGATGTELAAELHQAPRRPRRLRPRQNRPRAGHQDHAHRGGPAHPAGPARADLEGDRCTSCSVSASTSCTGARVVEVRADEVRLRRRRLYPVRARGLGGGRRRRRTCSADLDGLEVSRATSSSSTRRCRPRAIPTSSPSATAPPSCCRTGTARRSRRARRPRIRRPRSSRQLQRRLKGEPFAPFLYRDFGSLVSLGEYSTVGSLMGFIVGRASSSRAGCAPDVPLALQDARDGTARPGQGRPRHALAP